MKKAEGMLYAPASEKLLRLLEERHRNRCATFFHPMVPLLQEGAVGAFLLNAFLNDGRIGRGAVRYRSFFANSSVEALHGALKLARHRSHGRMKATGGAVLVADSAGLCQTLFDPLGRGQEAAMVPGIHPVEGPEAALEALARRPWAAVMVPLAEGLDLELAGRLAGAAKAQKAVFVLEGTRAPWETVDRVYRNLRLQPDLFIWGEAMTGYQVPFGAFSATADIHQAWSSLATCLLHSSTYGGNGLALTLLRDQALETLGWAHRYPGLRRRLEDLDKDPGALRSAFRRYVNPLTLELLKPSGLDVSMEEAEGSTLRLRESGGRVREVIDAHGAAGCALRGYNPPDIPGEVLARHDPEKDYWPELEESLVRLSGLGEAFPAVSGASAVEQGMTLALLARPERRRVVVFRGNYAGRTLLALAASTWSKERFFDPLYREIEVVDPWAEDAVSGLEEILASGEVALVHFELLQGQTSREIPDAVVAAVRDGQAQGGYLILVDEVLTGLYRTGSFLLQTARGLTADVVSLSKGLSDCTMPVAATLVSAEVAAAARKTNEALVNRLKSYYRHSLGAHIALHALEKAREEDLGAKVQAQGQALRKGLEELAKDSPLLSEVRGRGFCLRLVPDLDRFPFSFVGGPSADALLSRWSLQKGGVLLYYSRLNLALNASPEVVEGLLEGLRKALLRGRFRALLGAYGQVFRLLFRLPWVLRDARRTELALRPEAPASPSHSPMIHPEVK